MIFIAGFLVTRSRAAGIPAARAKTIYYTAVLRMDKSMREQAPIEISIPPIDAMDSRVTAN